MEEIIRKYFQCWLDKDSTSVSLLEKINQVYTNSKEEKVL
jgi:hypothetical protein